MEYFLPRITGAWIGRRQIIYVWDWSVSSDPIISWDVNYTVLCLHVKRQIIEEGKRCATLYLCFHLELVEHCLSFLCAFFSSSFFSPFLSTVYLLLGNITLSELIIFQRYCSQSLPWPVCMCVLDTHRNLPSCLWIHFHSLLRPLKVLYWDLVFVKYFFRPLQDLSVELFWYSRLFLARLYFEIQLLFINIWNISMRSHW